MEYPRRRGRVAEAIYFGNASYAKVPVGTLARLWKLCMYGNISKTAESKFRSFLKRKKLTVKVSFIR